MEQAEAESLHKKRPQISPGSDLSQLIRRLLVNRLLEGGAGFELHALRGLDLNLLAGGRVDAVTSCALVNGEVTETYERDTALFDDAVLEGANDGVDGALGVSTGAFEGFLYGFDEFCFVHMCGVGLG